jgi:hypothetical protein
MGRKGCDKSASTVDLSATNWSAITRWRNHHLRQGTSVRSVSIKSGREGVHLDIEGRRLDPIDLVRATTLLWLRLRREQMQPS